MATCKDCIHHDLCDAKGHLILTINNICELEYRSDVSEWWCKNYKPTADVAPKSEVIDEILSLIDDKIRFEVEMYNGFHSLKNGKTLCQERVNALNDIKLIINHQFRAELKKKYTEDKV